MELFSGALLYSVLLAIILHVTKNYKTLRNIVLLAYVIRVFFAIYHLYIGPWPYIGALPDSGYDELLFLHLAESISQSGFSLDVVRYGFAVNLFPIFIAPFFYIFGPYPIIGAVINSFFGIFTIIFIYKFILLIWTNELAAKRAALILAILPMQAVYSVIFIREAMFTFFLVGGIYYFFKYYFENARKKDIVLSITFLLVSIVLHDAVLVISPLLLYLILKRKKTNTAIMFIPMVMMIYFVISNYDFYKFTALFEGESLGAVLSENIARAQEQDRTFTYIDNLETANHFINYPYSIYNFYIRPYIWEYQVGFFRVFNSLLSITALFILIFNFKLIWRNVKSRILLLILLIMISVYAMGSSDLYQSDRHRSKFIPLSVALIAIAFRKKFKKL